MDEAASHSDPPKKPTSSSVTNSELLRRLRAGDEDAYGTIYRTWYEPMRRIAERMLRDNDAAEEVVQDVMLELWRRREQLVFEGSPQAYLFQSTRNRSLNRLRRARVESRDEFDTDTLPAHSSADADAVGKEMHAAFLEAVASLPPRCKQVFELNRVRGLRYAEVAEELGVTVKAVEAQMGKALKVMRDRLAPWIPPGKSL